MARGEKSANVREAAKRLGVTERTIWRWAAAGHIATDDADQMVETVEDRTCESCHTPLPQEATLRRRFCDDTCRVYARRDKLARGQFASSRPQAGPGGQPRAS